MNRKEWILPVIACVLAVLDEGDTYGYRLTQRMKEQVDSDKSTCSVRCV